MEAPKIVPQAEVLSRLESIVAEAINELENDLIPKLGHGEAKRLLIATVKYPQEVADFSGEKEALIRAYSATKAVKDAMVSLAVEVVIEQMLKQQVEANNAPSTEGDTNAES